MNLSLDTLNGTRTLNFKSDGLAGEGLDKDLHLKQALNINVLYEK
jgi:hypothetical protein